MAENSKPTAKRGKGKPFEKGKTGNPGGRPKIPDDIKQAFKDLTPAALKTLQEIINNPEAKDADRIRACEIALDRGWGKPVQAVDMETRIEKPVSIAFEGVLDEWSQ